MSTFRSSRYSDQTSATSNYQRPSVSDDPDTVTTDDNLSAIPNSNVNLLIEISLLEKDVQEFQSRRLSLIDEIRDIDSYKQAVDGWNEVDSWEKDHGRSLTNLATAQSMKEKLRENLQRGTFQPGPLLPEQNKQIFRINKQIRDNHTDRTRQLEILLAEKRQELARLEAHAKNG